MKKEDLKVGMKIIDKETSKIRTITALGEQIFLSMDKHTFEASIYYTNLHHFQPLVEPEKLLEIYLEPADYCLLKRGKDSKNSQLTTQQKHPSFIKFREVIEEE